MASTNNTQAGSPFLPQEVLLGPTFLDTQTCLCGLQPAPRSDGSVIAAWQCIGNQSQGLYKIRTGKWFNSIHGGTELRLSIDDATNGPETSKPLMWGANNTLVDFQRDHLSVVDQACTGENKTIFSTELYRALQEQSLGQQPVDAAPCYRPGVVPVTIQNRTSWQSQGCSKGFLCANNTVNTLPQHCPPTTECQKARVAGGICSVDNQHVPMGPFEPVVCQQGWYCPTSSGGANMYRCPAGSYCQPGAATPTPCNTGSICPEGSEFQRFLIPVIMILIFDVLLILGTVLVTFRSRLLVHWRTTRSGAIDEPNETISTMRSTSMTLESQRALSEHLTNRYGQFSPYSPDSPKSPYSPTPGYYSWEGSQADPSKGLDLNRTSVLFCDEESPQLKEFIASTQRAIGDVNFRLSFQYYGLTYQPKRSSKPIIRDITGSIRSGSVVGIMGGSGAGKTTFVNVLMGKLASTSGSVAVNNTPGHINRYKKLIGYVPQDDIMLPESTVYENICHSARVRLPRAWSDIEIEAHVNTVIECLELSGVRDSLVGTVGKPIISGGQCKRVSIGMELAAAPMAIILDEPTSGLDSTVATSVMRTLKALTRLGVTIIVVIHQPRMEIFEILDDLLLLADGQAVYQGPEVQARQYFGNIGYRFSKHSNFGDVVTDIVTGNGRIYKKTGDVSKGALVAQWPNSRQNIRMKSKMSSITAPDPQSVNEIIRQRGASRLQQLRLCICRAFLQQWRTKLVFSVELGLAAVSGLLLGVGQDNRGVMFQGIYKEPYEDLSSAVDYKSAPQMALLTALAIGLDAAAPGVKLFSEELLMHRREAEAGHSRSAYFLAKTLSVFPRMILNCIHLTAFLLILAVPIIPWSTAFGTNLLYYYCIYGLASCVSMIVPREDAPLFATMAALIAGVMSGTAPQLSNVKKWHLEWLWRISPGTWMAEIYFSQLVSPLAYLYDIDLAAKATGFHLLHGTAANLAILFTIGTVFRLLAFISLFAAKRIRL